MINIYITNLFQFFKLCPIWKDINLTTLIEVQANEYNCGIKISDIKIDAINKNLLIEYLMTYPNINYFEINNSIVINNKYIDNMASYILYRSFNSFHQNDDNIRNAIYDYILKHDFNVDNLILFGGEMYGYTKFFLTVKNLYAYSDYEGLIDDTIYNLENKYEHQIIEHVNYELFKTKLFDIDKSLIICNTSKTGLGYNMANEICKINSTHLIIVSCNKKSYIRDYEILKNNYILVETLSISFITVYYFITNKKK